MSKIPTGPQDFGAAKIEANTVFAESINSLREEVVDLNSRMRMLETANIDMASELAKFRELAVRMERYGPVRNPLFSPLSEPLRFDANF